MAMKSITVGVFTSAAQAEAAINEVRKLDIPDASISYLYQNKKGELEHGTADEAVEEPIADTAKQATAGAASGVVTGGAVGALAGLAVVTGVLPGLGALFIGGPLAAALGLSGTAATVAAGAATGALAGGLIGALTSVGITEPDAHLYEERIKRGEIMVIVESTIAGVHTIFTSNGAEEVREYTKN